MKILNSLICRVFFISAFLFLICAISEKFAHYLGESIFKYPPSQLIGFAAVALLFVIALELRNIIMNIEIYKEGEKQSSVQAKNNKASSYLTTAALLVIILFLTT